MKRSNGGLIVFFASIFVGLLITFNTNFGEIIKKSTQLSAKDYQNAINERNDLYKEISNLTERNDEIVYNKDDFNITLAKLLTDMVNEEKLCKDEKKWKYEILLYSCKEKMLFIKHLF